jgi:hypothetical protein
MSCSPAELISVSIEQFKFQFNQLYLQTVEKSNHLPYCSDLKIDFKILQQLTNCKYMKIPKDYQNETYFNEQVTQLKKMLPNCKIEY